MASTPMSLIPHPSCLIPNHCSLAPEPFPCTGAGTGWRCRWLKRRRYGVCYTSACTAHSSTSRMCSSRYISRCRERTQARSWMRHTDGEPSSPALPDTRSPSATGPLPLFDDPRANFFLFAFFGLLSGVDDVGTTMAGAFGSSMETWSTAGPA